MIPDSAAFRTLHFVADGFNPALTLLALATPFLPGGRRGWPATLRYFLAALAGLGVVYGVRALDGRFGLWALAGLDYSTHTAYAASLATTIAGWRRRWTLPLGMALAGYAFLILVLRFHGPVDVLAAAVVAAPASWLAYRLLGPRTPPAGRELTREGAGDYDPTRA